MHKYLLDDNANDAVRNNCSSNAFTYLS